MAFEIVIPVEDDGKPTGVPLKTGDGGVRHKSVFTVSLRVKIGLASLNWAPLLLKGRNRKKNCVPQKVKFGVN